MANRDMTEAVAPVDLGISLYDRDYLAWAEAQRAALTLVARRFDAAPVDWENLIEEIEALGRSEVDRARSGLMRIIEHLLKLEYSPAPEPRQGWRESVVNHRVLVLDTLDRSPSVRGKLDLDGPFRNARRIAAVGLERDGVDASSLPAACPYSFAQVLDHDWWPGNHHGLGGGTPA